MNAYLRCYSLLSCIVFAQVLLASLFYTALCAGPDSTAVADSARAVTDSLTAAADSAGAPRMEPLDPLVALRARGTLSLLFADTLSSRNLSPRQFARAFPFYLDDVVRLLGSFTGGDTLGNGYARQISSPGAGFASTGVFLDGMQLADPLTSRVDWRILPVEIVQRASYIDGGSLGGVAGWADEIHLFSRYPGPAIPVTRMGIGGGAYEINKVGGGLRRKMFGSGAINVQINKIQQSTEDFNAKVENIQYYTRVQQQLSPAALLAVDGLFFSDSYRRSGFSRRRTAATRIRTSLTGALGGGGYGYSLSWGYADGEQPFDADSLTINAGAASHRLNATLRSDPRRAVNWAVEAGLVSTGLKNFPTAFEGEGSRRQARLALRMGIGGQGPLRLQMNAGARSVSGGDSRAVGGFTLNYAPSGMDGLWLSWQRDAVAPSAAAVLSAYGTLVPDSEFRTGVLDHLEAGWSRRAPGGWQFSLAAFQRRLAAMPVEPPRANPFRRISFRTASANLTGLSYRAAGTLFGFLETGLMGMELFNPPDDVPWLPSRRISATAEIQGLGYDGDLGWSLRGETVYEGALYYPLGAAPSGALREQPGRVNFFGAASVRIIDFTIYGRADFLASDYYNGIDPLRQPGPRVVVGVDWVFRD